MSDLTLAVDVGVGTGWLALEDAANGFEIESSSFSDRTIGAKQHSIGDDMVWLDGEVVVATAPTNVTENVSVWVTGTDPFDFDSKVQQVIDAFSQVTYKLRRTINNSKQTWTCYASTQIRITTSQAYLVATTGLVAVTVNRSPSVLLESV